MRDRLLNIYLRKKIIRATKAANSIQEKKFPQSGHESERVSYPTTVLSFPPKFYDQRPQFYTKQN